jgi:hypothetical protein
MPKYLVVHPKLALRIKKDGDKKPKLQNAVKGTELTLEEAAAKSLVNSGKLKLIATKKEKQEK